MKRSIRVASTLLALSIFPGAAAWAQSIGTASQQTAVELAVLATRAPQLLSARPSEHIPASVPPAPWAQKDPADSLYRAAREALNQGENARAAELFQSIPRRYPQSTYAADALYWEGFARYRIGGTTEFQRALAVLETQRAKYPDAATSGDARALANRIQGELARLGSAAAAAAVTRNATTVIRLDTIQGITVLGGSGRVLDLSGLGGGGYVLDAGSREIAAVGREIASMSRGVAAISRDIAAVNREMAATGRATMLSSRGLGELPESCSRDDAEIRTAALNALLQVDAERAVPVLRQVLARRDACSGPLRRTAVFLVSQKMTPETETVLLEAARKDPDLQVQKSAVFYLSQVRSDRAVTILEEILRTPADSALQTQALFALSQHQDERAQRALRAYAARADAPDRLRGTAIFWVGQNPAPDNLAFLQHLYGQLQDDQLKARILYSVAQRAEPANSRWLLGVANNASESMETRKTALFHAGTSNGVSIQELLTLYQRLTDQTLKQQMIFILSQRQEPAAFDKLIEIARKESDSTLRKQAIHWLSQSKDPRATEVLLEIIGGT